MTKDELENYIFEYTIEVCIELNLHKSGNLEELYKTVKHRLNNIMYLRFTKDYVTGYVDIYCSPDDFNYEISMYINEMDIKLSATELIRGRKLKEMFD